MADDDKKPKKKDDNVPEGKIKVTESKTYYKDAHEKHGPKLPASMKTILLIAGIAAFFGFAAALSFNEPDNRQAGVQTPPGSNRAATPTPNPLHKGLLGSPGSAPDPVIRKGGGTGAVTTAACAGRKHTVVLQPGVWVDIDKYNACRVMSAPPPGVRIQAMSEHGEIFDLLPNGEEARNALRVRSVNQTVPFSYSRCPKGLPGMRNWDCSLLSQYAIN